MKRLKYIILLLIMIALVNAQVLQAPIPVNAPLVDGGDSPFRSGGNTALCNPGKLPAYYQSQVYARYEKLYWGIDNLNEASLAANYTLTNMAAGINMHTFSQDMMSETTVKLMYGQRIGKPGSIQREEKKHGLFAGVLTGIHIRSYNKDNFDLADPDDPLLQGDLTKFNISGGFGLFYREDWGNLFMVGSELNQPDMALDEDVQDRMPMTMQVGAGFPIFKKMQLMPLITWHPVYEDMSKDLSASLSMSYYIADGLNVSMGGGNDEVTFKGSYQFDRRKGFFVTYEAEYPLHGIKNTSHKFGLGYRLEPPPPLYPDLYIKSIDFDGTPLPGNENRIVIRMKNKGRRPAAGYNVALFIDGKLIETISGDKIDSGEEGYSSYNWQPSAPGEYTIVARVDDDGQMYPDFNGKILEIDEENNSFSAQRQIYDKPTLDIKIDKDEFRLTQLISITEDEPMIPLVFFEKDNAQVSSRFDQMLGVVAKRLSRNLDAVVTIYGYVGEEEGNAKLALERAENLRKRLLRFEPSISDRVLVSRTHNLQKPRAVKEKFQGTRKGKIYTAQENRRARIEIQSKESFTRAIDNVASFSDSDVITVVRLLKENPDYELILQGANLISCMNMEKPLIEKIGAKYNDRIFSQTVGSINNGGCRLNVTASGIIYKPIRRMSKAEDFIVDSNWDEAFYELTPVGPLEITSFQISVIDLDDKVVYTEKLAGNDNKSSWKWRDNNGRFASPGDKFVIKAIATDKLGQTVEAISDTLEVIVKNKNEVKEKLILSQFTFAGAETEIDYGAARVEYLAKRLINMIENEAGGTILVSGHTDVVGVKSSHQRLSLERAEEQGKRLREYLMNLLNFANEDALDSWFRSRNFRFIMKGYGSDRPYSITRRDGDIEREITIGNNDLPEGRIANRRVEIEFVPSGVRK